MGILKVQAARMHALLLNQLELFYSYRTERIRKGWKINKEKGGPKTNMLDH